MKSMKGVSAKIHVWEERIWSLHVNKTIKYVKI